MGKYPTFAFLKEKVISIRNLATVKLLFS